MSEEERPPSWAGARGYGPPRDLPPHALMPGAPPYPPGTAHGSAPVGRPARRTPLRTALAASVVWAVVSLGPVVGGLPPDAHAAGAFVGSALVTALVAAAVT